MSGAATLTLRQGGARVDLAPAAGGAIARFAVDDIDVMRAMPAAAIVANDVRQSSSYPLVPYSNRIRDGVLHHAGKAFRLARNFGDHPHAIHGVGWQRPWAVARATKDAAVLELEHDAVDDAARAAWPWSFAATQAFALAADDVAARLSMTLTLRNRSSEVFPFGLGFHPYFTRSPATTLAFVAAHAWRNDDTQLPVERVAAAGTLDFAHPRPLAGVDLDTVFSGWQGRAVLATPGRFEVDIEADSAMGFLVVYAPAQRDFVAVEPVTHETDAFNREASGETQTGTRLLPPGAAFSCTMRVTVRRAHNT